jgi:exosortase
MLESETKRNFTESAPLSTLPRTSQPAWRSVNKYHALGSILLLALISILYAGVFRGMSGDWLQEETAAYCILAPPIAVGVAFSRRKQVAMLPAEPNLWGLVLLAGGCLLFLLGIAGADEFTQRISFLGVLAGLIWTFWGVARLKALAFPLGLLATMVPLPGLLNDRIAVPLQLLASQAASTILEMAGKSVYVDGNIIQLSSTTLGVAEACSGLSSLSALFIGSLLVGFLNCRSLAARLVLVACSIPVAVAVNILRVTGTAVVADYDERYATGFYHTLSGWMVFLIGYLALWYLALLLSRVFDRERES